MREHLNKTVLPLKKYKLLQWLLLIAAVFYITIIVSFDPAQHWWIPKCPLLWATGIRCPGCGSQRTIHAIMHGQWATAWQTHPLLFFAIPYILLGFYAENTLHTPLGRWLRVHLFGKVAILICMAVILVYAVVRNVQGW
jgi:Protein of unknown function (DUF2752)